MRDPYTRQRGCPKTEKTKNVFYVANMMMMMMMMMMTRHNLLHDAQTDWPGM
jgi:hypothetical protein